ncbi:MAG: ABC transporter substrate-binding protein [Desulfobacterales bacterium]|nr:ABC transporter substrate-binding protein [Desulfobacterales bacterium]MCP4161895.1 ABC transporter substrate-binding protein [Deltaproteobacteria bacterium]
MKSHQKIREQKTLSLSPDMLINDVIKTWPQTVATFSKMGFSSFKIPIFRKLFTRNLTIESAAKFKNVDLNILLINLQNAIANPTTHNESFIDPNRLRFDENTVPDLTGDLSMFGIIPCPVRNVIIERFDSFIQENYTKRDKKVAWWLASGGPSIMDIKNYIKSTVKSNQFETFPDLFLSVGTEVFLHDDFCRPLYKENFFKQTDVKTRADLKKLEDPNGILQLQFAAIFTFYCIPESLGGLPLPNNWFDLTDPKYKGHIVLPSLNLPVIPDLLSALYFHLGDSHFIKFCQNVKFALHPSHSSDRKIKKNSPGIFVTPMHFSKIKKSPGHVNVIPEDGFIAVPAYIAKTSQNSEVSKMEDFLLSKELLDIYYNSGFMPNNPDIETEYPMDNLITRPWSSLFDNIPDEFLQQLLRNFKLEVSA